MTISYRASLVTAITCWVATFAAFSLHLDNPWWATISAWVIASPDKGAFWQKGILRICGTLAGCALGYELAILFVGKPLLQAICFFLLGFCSSYMRFRSRFGYAWTLGGIAALLLMSVSLSAPEALYTFAHYRAYEIACGVGSALLCDAILGMLLGFKGSTTPANSNPSKNESLKNNQGELITVALVGGLTALILPILWSLFNLPSLPQSLVTVLVLLDPNLEATRFKGFQRFLGCIVGGGVGIIVSALAIDSFLVWSVFLILGVVGFSRLHLSDSRWAYTGTQGGLAFIIALVTGNGPPDTIDPIVSRICGIAIGVLIFMGIVFIVRRSQTRMQATGQGI
jgi:uncharacterized membrane protein YccC